MKLFIAPRNHQIDPGGEQIIAISPIIAGMLFMVRRKHKKYQNFVHMLFP